VIGLNGHYYFDSSSPLMLMATLYKHKKTGVYQKKISKLVVKLQMSGEFKNVAFVDVDLASYCARDEQSWEVKLPLLKCADKRAALNVTIHSRWIDDESLTLNGRFCFLFLFLFCLF
jgi:hypothetical protein